MALAFPTPPPSPNWQTQRRSHSQRRTYRTCGLKYLYQYKQGWRSTHDRGTYRFGTVVGEIADLMALRLVRTPDAAEALFRAKWAPFQEDPTLTWTERGPWVLLRDRGVALVRAMVPELQSMLGRPDAAHLQERIEYHPGNALARELCIPDFYGPVKTIEGWKPGVIDFKTADRTWEETAAEIDEQLTDYQLAEASLTRPVDVVGLCVLIYTKVPKIQWLLSPARDDEEQERFIAGVQRVDRLIRAGEFDRNPASCHVMGACPFIPLCYPSQQDRIETDLVQWTPTGEPPPADPDET